MTEKGRNRSQPVTHICEDKDGVWETKETTIIQPDKQKGLKPAMSPESRENQLVNLAVSLAEKQLRDGTASSAVIVHYLKLASKREHLERMILERQAKLIEAKAESIAKDRDAEDLAKAAIDAMKNYGRG